MTCDISTYLDKVVTITQTEPTTCGLCGALVESNVFVGVCVGHTQVGTEMYHAFLLDRPFVCPNCGGQKHWILLPCEGDQPSLADQLFSFLKNNDAN